MDNMAITLGKRNLVDSIWSSANIEGLGTTFPSTKAILENLPVYTKQEEVYFICNMKRAWEFLFDNIDYPVNMMFLRELHKIALQNLIYQPGEVCSIPVTIGGTDWVPEIPHPAVVAEDLQKIMDNGDKLEAALDTFCFLARTQTFVDGNKRMAQLVSNKILMQNDIGILRVPVSRQKDFTDMLINFYETNDNHVLKDFLRSECICYAHVKEKENGYEVEELQDR